MTEIAETANLANISENTKKKSDNSDFFLKKRKILLLICSPLSAQCLHGEIGQVGRKECIRVALA
jgi:hypothetical protein